MTNKKLSNKIKQLRKTNAWSQSHLAEAAGVSTRTVQRLEKTGECSGETLLSVAGAFDIDVASLTELIDSDRRPVNSDQNEKILSAHYRKTGVFLSFKNWITNNNRGWHRLAAVTGGMLLIVPASFFLIGVLKYSAGLDGIPNPYELFYTSEPLLKIWNTLSPIIFLGSLALAAVLNLLPFLDLKIASKNHSLFSSIRYRGDVWNWTIMILSLIIMAAMAGYVATENIAEAAIRNFSY